MKRSAFSLKTRTIINRQRRYRQNLKSIRRLQRDRRIVFYFQEQEQNI